MTDSSTNTPLISIVADTNQFLSVFIFRGQLMRQVFELVLNGKIRMFVSPALISEVQEKLEFFKVSQIVQNEVMLFIQMRGMLVEPTVTVDVCRDPEDNFNLELAESTNADYLITRDKDLLDLKQWKRTVIMKPEDFLPRLREVGIL